MNTKPKVSGIIMSAGSGARMGGVEKPFIKLNGKTTVYERVLDAFMNSNVDEIVVVCKNEEDYWQLTPQTLKPVRMAKGGDTRSNSVFNGVNEATSEYCCVHDCARPFVTSEMINTLIAASFKTGAATACCTVTDTIKYVNSDQNTIYTPERKHLLAIQTPQCFRKDNYLAAFSQAEQGREYTDETSLLENAGFKVEYTLTSTSNIKLTTAEDVKKAKIILYLEEKGL